MLVRALLASPESFLFNTVVVHKHTHTPPRTHVFSIRFSQTNSETQVENKKQKENNKNEEKEKNNRRI